MAYHADVEFLDECSPALIERNAAEFSRIGDLLRSVEPSVNKARYRTVWESVYRQNFDARLADVANLVTELAAGFAKARIALVKYADEVEIAKRHLENGVQAEITLDGLIMQVADPITRTAQQAEPMRRWEDLRSTTGFLDWVAELGVVADSIREDANRAYSQADEAFSRAQSVEKAARDTCLAELKAAYATLPDFRGGDFKEAAELARSIDPLLKEIAQAGSDPNVRLPGSTEKQDSLPGAGAVSPSLQRIRDLLTSLPQEQREWWHDFEVISSDEEREKWINEHKEFIHAAAAETALPADMIAGIAWREIGGQPPVSDVAVEAVRSIAEHWGPVPPEDLPGRLGGDPDETSYGPLAVQIRRGAEALGYDPENLSDQQRDEIRSALKDPAQNVFVAAKHLANLKAESGFANVPAEEMTVAHYEELAARYNGGPHWQEAQAQDYGRYVAEHRQVAGEALR